MTTYHTATFPLCTAAGDCIAEIDVAFAVEPHTGEPVNITCAVAGDMSRTVRPDLPMLAQIADWLATQITGDMVADAARDAWARDRENTMHLRRAAE